MPQLKRLAQKPRTKSTDNSRVVELRKERSRDAARSRRGKENAQFDELAKLLPLPGAITSQLDKASIVRLTISYLNMKQFGKRSRHYRLSTCSLLSESSASPQSDLDIDASPGSPSPPSSISSPPPVGGASASGAVVPYNPNTTDFSDLAANSGIFLLQALDGFLFVLSSDAKVLYVSETVSVHLGLSQVELTGSSMFCYIHPEDQQDLINVLESAKEELENPSNQSAATGKYTDDIPFFGNSPQATFLDEDGHPTKEKPKSFFLRMKCTLVRRGGSYTKSSGFKVIHCMGRMKRYSAGGLPGPKYAFVAIAQPLPTMNINELPLECNMFVSRVNMDLKIVYCEGRIHKFMDYFARDIVGMSAYDFYHGNDVAVIQGHHAKFLTRGQVLTKYYRWMNKNGGWVWMQTKASLIPHPTNPELKQMLCLNYLVSDVEHRGVVLGMAQLEDKPSLTDRGYITEVESESDVGSELKDAQYDDQVMVYPKWHETSDNLVPKPTLMDVAALTRTGYPQATVADATGLENDVFTTSAAQSWGQAGTSTITSDGNTGVSRLSNLPAEGGGSSSSTLDDDFDDWAKMINAELNELDRDIVKFVATGGDDIAPLPDTSLESLLNTNSLGLQSNGAIQNLIAPKIEEIPMDSDQNPAISSLNPVNAQNMPPPRMPSAAFGSVPMDSFVGDTKPLIPMSQGDLSTGLGLTGSKLRPVNSPCMFGNATSGERGFQQKAPSLSHLSTATSSNAPMMNIPPQQTQNIPAARGQNPAMNMTQSRNLGRMQQMQRSDMTSTTGNGNFKVPVPVLPSTKQNDIQQQFIQLIREFAPQDSYSDQMVVDLVYDMMTDADKRKDEDMQLASLLQQGGFAQIDEVPEIEIKQEVVTPTLSQPTSSFPIFSDSMAKQSSQPQVFSSSTSTFTSTNSFNQLPGNSSTMGAPSPIRPQNGTVHNQNPPLRFQNGNNQFVNQGDNNMNFLMSNTRGMTSTQTGTSMANDNLWNSNTPPTIKQNAMQQGLRNLLQNSGTPPPNQTVNFQTAQTNSSLLSQQPNMPFLPQQGVANMMPQNGSRNNQSSMFNTTVVPNVGQMSFQEQNQLNSLLQSVPLQGTSYQNINGASMSFGNQHYPNFDINRKQ